VSVPICRGHRWIFSLSTCHAGSAAPIRPKAVFQFSVVAHNSHAFNTGEIPMAVWQFKFTLVPTEGIVKTHGQVPDYLPQFAAVAPDACHDDEMVWPNYWEGVDKSAFHALARSVLPVADSWSTEATMYGHSKRDDIQVWDDSVDVRLDCSNLNVKLLESIVAIADDCGCYIVLCESGRVIAPVSEQVIDALKASSAARFVKDPNAFLVSSDRIFPANVG
jgi:hypothetical protein